MGHQCVEGGLLFGFRRGSERELMRRSVVALVGERESAAGLLDQLAEAVQQPAGKYQIPGHRLIEVAEEAR